MITLPRDSLLREHIAARAEQLLRLGCSARYVRAYEAGARKHEAGPQLQAGHIVYLRPGERLPAGLR